MTIRERAYDVVKRMKSAYSQDGCDWQVAIERALLDAVETEREACALLVEPSRAADDDDEAELCWELATAIRNRGGVSQP